MNKVTRRQFLVQGGAAVSLAALVVACGDTTGPADPGRIGNGDEGEPLPEIEVDDVVLARTAQSVHHSAAKAQQGILDSGYASEAVAALLPTVIEAHVAQAARLGELTGGNPFDCPNPFFDQRFVDPSLEKLSEESSNKTADADKLAIAFEEWVARSHQDLASAVGPEARATVVSIGTENARHSVALSLSAGEPEMSPTFFGDDAVESDEDGYPIYYALSSRFGVVSAVPVVIGDLDEEGQRFSFNMQTPADNSYVGPEASCTS